MPTETAAPLRVICDTSDKLADAAHFLSRCLIMAKDVETIPHVSAKKSAKLSKYPFVMTVDSFTGINSDGEMRSYAVQLTRQKSPIMAPPALLAEILYFMRDMNALTVPKVLHNGVYDAAWYMRYQCPLVNYAYDSMTMFWARYPDLPKTLDFVSSVMLDDHRFWKMGRKEENFIAHTIYAMQDTETTLRSALRLIRWMRDDPDMLRNFQHAHMRNLSGLEMSMKGAPVDFELRAEMEQLLIEEKEEKLARFRKLVGDPEFNPNSPKQKADLFYTHLGAKPRNAKGRELKRITANTKVSTGKLPLKGIKTEHPILAILVDALDDVMVPGKQLSNVMGLEFPDGRFRTNYDGIGTTTTRYASRGDAFGFGGNAQNIRKKFRKIVSAEPNCFLIELDFSAADDVFVSYESEEEKKIDLVESGKDTHSYNAAEVFFKNWEYDAVVAGKKADDPRIVHPITGIRQITKKVTHGANYLMAGMTLLMSAGREAVVGAAKALGHENAHAWNMNQLAEFCEWLDAQYRIFYPRFKRTGSDSFYSDLTHQLVHHGSYTSIFHYRQRFINDPRDDRTLRACAASVGQANTAGRVNMAMDELVHGVRMVRFRDGEAPDADEPALRVNEFEHGISLWFQTHDSFTFNVDPSHSNWQEGVDRIFKVMRRPVISKGRVVRIGVEADVSVHWAHKSEFVDNAADCESWWNRISENYQP